MIRKVAVIVCGVLVCAWVGWLALAYHYCKEHGGVVRAPIKLVCIKKGTML